MARDDSHTAGLFDTVTVHNTTESGQLITMHARRERWLLFRGWRFRCEACGTTGWMPKSWLVRVVRVHLTWHHEHPRYRPKED